MTMDPKGLPAEMTLGADWLHSHATASAGVRAQCCMARSGAAPPHALPLHGKAAGASDIRWDRTHESGETSWGRAGGSVPR